MKYLPSLLRPNHRSGNFSTRNTMSRSGEHTSTIIALVNPQEVTFEFIWASTSAEPPTRRFCPHATAYLLFKQLATAPDSPSVGPASTPPQTEQPPETSVELQSQRANHQEEREATKRQKKKEPPTPARDIGHQGRSRPPFYGSCEMDGGVERKFLKKKMAQTNLRFKVGQTLEVRSFEDGYRGAWLRCEVWSPHITPMNSCYCQILNLN
ncbi:hypothetical protein YC2023_035671 [Brassica napus]